MIRYYNIGAEVDACKAESEQFEIGVVSPAKAKSEMDDVYGEFGRFNSDVSVSKASDKFKHAWGSFYDDFLKWYRDNAEGVMNWLDKLMTSGAYKKAKEYRCRLRDWRSGLNKEVPGSTTEPERRTQHQAETADYVKYGVVGLLGVGLIAALRK